MARRSRNRALNAFSTAPDDDTYIRGMRQQQDIDPEYVADDEIRGLLSGQVQADDDEDIDSDEAMGSGSDISLGEPDASDNDADEWGDSLDEAELLPLSEVWDMDDDESSAEVSSGPDSRKSSSAQVHDEIKDSIKNSTKKSVRFEADSSSDVDSKSEEQPSDSESASDESESDEEDFAGFSDESDIDSEDDEVLKKAMDKAATGQAKERHRLAAYAGTENPLALPATSGEKLSLEDLGMAPAKKSAAKSQPLSVPAPQRVQQRADRSAAYELTKEQVSQWEDTVKANRRAEHLQFPLQPRQLEESTPFAPQASSESPDSLESRVSAILRQSSLADERAAERFEEMAPSKLSLEELRERRDRLRQMRELMFREEQRAKRIKKIKSKSYRRIHKKEREKMAELDSDQESPDEEELLRRRALERASLRHKSSSKWARRMADQGLTRDAGTRAELDEMLRQSDDLRRRIGIDSEHTVGEYDDMESETRDLQAEADNLRSDHNGQAEQKGIMGMKFMQDAAKREREANERLLRDDFEDGETQQNPGRRTFTPAGQQLKRDLEQPDGGSQSKRRKEVGEEEVITRIADGDSKGQHIGQAKEDNSQDDSNETQESTNPWLQLGSGKKGRSTYTALGANSSKQDRAQAQLKQSRGRSGTTIQQGSVGIALENTLDGADTLTRERDLTLQQQDLVRRAFAGDDVAAAFEAEKREIVEDEGDKEIDETLPGWGSWSSQPSRVKRVRRVAGIDPKKRKDYKHKDVIINERINKKAADRYAASAVPFPFENRAQYERSLRMPLGQEWVSKDTFQRQTKPRVLVKRGEVIDPLRAKGH